MIDEAVTYSGVARPAGGAPVGPAAAMAGALAALAALVGGFVGAAADGTFTARLPALTAVALAAALTAAVAVTWLLRRKAAGGMSGMSGMSGASGASGARAAAAAPLVFDNSASGVGAAHGGARLLAGQVVPVWHRQLEASRTEAEKGLGGLLESFNQLSSGLAAAAEASARGQQTQLGAGAADEIVENRQELIDQMLTPAQALLAFRAEVQEELRGLSELMPVLGRLAKDLDALARHARLVAMNASIEANRAGQAQAGFGAVAREVLTLSTTAAGHVQRLATELRQAEGRHDALRERLELDTANAETLGIELRQRARTLVTAIVGDMGDALAGSRELRETSQQLQGALENVFVGFQFQDRFTQMLGSVLTDMTRFVEWLDEGRGASHADAVAWLKRLDDTYTMEQQRSQHHGTAHVGTSPAVEFF